MNSQLRAADFANKKSLTMEKYGWEYDGSIEFLNVILTPLLLIICMFPIYDFELNYEMCLSLGSYALLAPVLLWTELETI